MMTTETADCRHENRTPRVNRRGMGLGHDHGGRGGFAAWICQDCGAEFCEDPVCRPRYPAQES